MNDLYAYLFMFGMGFGLITLWLLFNIWISLLKLNRRIK